MQVSDDSTLEWPDKLKVILTSAQGISIVASIGTMGMTPLNAMIRRKDRSSLQTRKATTVRRTRES